MNKLISILATSVVLAACGDSDSLTPTPPPPTPPPPTALDFTTFVKAEIANTTDDRDPVEINDLEFEFADLDNPAAYDDLFTTP